MSRRFFWIGVIFEFGLAIAGLLLGWLFGLWPPASLLPEASGEKSIWFGESPRGWIFGLGLGLLATIPMIVAGYLAYLKPPQALQRLRQTADELLGPLFGNLPLFQLALLSLAAGIGEEIFFRGLIQQGVSNWFGGTIGAIVGLLIASTLFGIVHWLHSSYAFVAGVLGIYLGILMWLGDGLLAPITAHAAYDFAALVFLQHRYQASRSNSDLPGDSNANMYPDSQSRTEGPDASGDAASVGD